MWVAGGFGLVVLELVTPSGFFIIFFGLAAITVGALARLALVDAWWGQWLTFTALSVAYLLLFRGRLQSRFQNPPPSSMDTFVGELAVVQEPIEPGTVGRVEVRGAAWSARNVSDARLDTGQRCKVLTVSGLLLTVAPE